MPDQQSQPAQYLAIANDLAARLHEFGAGGRLPTETELAHKLQVNRLTARAAIQELERRFLVRRFRGRGTFVSSRIDYMVSADSPPSWNETVRRAGATPAEKTESIELVRRPSAAARKALDLRKGEHVIALSRLRYVNDELAGCSDVLLNAAVVPELENKLEPGASIYRYLHDHYRLEPYRGFSQVSLEVPPGDVIERLGSPAQSLLFRHCSRVDSASARRPVEYVTAWLRPDIVRLRVCYGTQEPPNGVASTSREEESVD